MTHLFLLTLGCGFYFLSLPAGGSLPAVAMTAAFVVSFPLLSRR